MATLITNTANVTKEIKSLTGLTVIKKESTSVRGYSRETGDFHVKNGYIICTSLEVKEKIESVISDSIRNRRMDGAFEIALIGCKIW